MIKLISFWLRLLRFMPLTVFGLSCCTTGHASQEIEFDLDASLQRYKTYHEEITENPLGDSASADESAQALNAFIKEWSRYLKHGQPSAEDVGSIVDLFSYKKGRFLVLGRPLSQDIERLIPKDSLQENLIALHKNTARLIARLVNCGGDFGVAQYYFTSLSKSFTHSESPRTNAFIEDHFYPIYLRNLRISSRIEDPGALVDRMVTLSLSLRDQETQANSTKQSVTAALIKDARTIGGGEDSRLSALFIHSMAAHLMQPNDFQGYRHLGVDQDSGLRDYALISGVKGAASSVDASEAQVLDIRTIVTEKKQQQLYFEPHQLEDKIALETFFKLETETPLLEYQRQSASFFLEMILQFKTRLCLSQELMLNEFCGGFVTYKDRVLPLFYRWYALRELGFELADFAHQYGDLSLNSGATNGYAYFYHLLCVVNQGENPLQNPHEITAESVLFDDLVHSYCTVARLCLRPERITQLPVRGKM